MWGPWNSAVAGVVDHFSSPDPYIATPNHFFNYWRKISYAPIAVTMTWVCSRNELAKERQALPFQQLAFPASYYEEASLQY